MLFKNIAIIGEDYAVLENHFLQTDGDTITYIGIVPPDNYAGETYDGKGKALLPGFYNTHCHVPMSLIRGYGEGLSLHDWLFTRMFPFEDLLTDDDCYWGTLLGACEMIASGVCSFSDMYMFMEGITRGTLQSGLKANISRGLSSTKSEALADMDYLLNFAKNDKSGRIIAEYAIHSEYTTNKEAITDISGMCKEKGMCLQVHISETKSEHDECKARHGMTPAAWFNSLGAFDNKTTAAHCVWVEDEDIDIFAGKGVTVSHCPASNLKLGSGIAPITKFVKKGVNVALGTDGAASNNNLNMMEDITLAALTQKGYAHDPLCVTTTDMLRFACENGAKAQGRENCGQIKVGNKADLIVLNLNAPHLQPLYDLLSTIIHSAQASDIVLNMVDGKILYKDGVFLTIDVEQVMFNARRIRDEKLKLL